MLYIYFNLKVASYCNGAVIVPSMAASWASAKLLGYFLIFYLFLTD